MKLRQRFESFIHTMRGFESIDQMLKGKHLPEKKRADYFLWDRQVIVEQKTLIVDPVDKPQKFVDQLMKERGFVIYGTVSTKRIFEGQPDGEELQHKMIRAITKGLEDSVADADKQTRDTREIFGTPNATGILVLLNESAPLLQPEVIRYALAHVFAKRREDESIRYPHNDGVILISEAHAEISPRGRGAPAFGGRSPHAKSPDVVAAFTDELIERWSAFNQLPLIQK